LQSPCVDKGALRREALLRLRTIAPGERERAREQIAQRVWALPEVAGARVLLLYASLPEEVPTDGIAREALRRGITVAYPRTSPGGSMALHEVEHPGQLEVWRWGIREPNPAIHPQCPIRAVDAALIPGLGWDRGGQRLGRGGGFYDRLLAAAEWRGFRCGIFFALQERPGLPADPWDVPLDAVVTETELWKQPGHERPGSTTGLPDAS
jgi:5-formyltetrahydrofolate cyclo-ligase